MSKSKTLCDWSRKDIAKNLDVLSEIVRAPAYVCGKCARTSSAKNYLCRPVKLELSAPVVLEISRKGKRKRPAA